MVLSEMVYNAFDFEPYSFTVHQAIAITLRDLSADSTQEDENKIFNKIKQIFPDAGRIKGLQKLSHYALEQIELEKSTGSMSLGAKDIAEAMVGDVIRQKEAPVSITPVYLGQLSSAFVVRQGSDIAVYLRDTKNGLVEMGNNLETQFIESTTGNRHKGFEKTLDTPLPMSFTDQVKASLDAMKENKIYEPVTFHEKITEIVKAESEAAKAEGFPNPNVTLAGMSRGGALATALADRWLTQQEDVPLKQVFSMGSPASGDEIRKNHLEALAKEKGVEFVRAENGEDIIPHMPPEFLGYRQVGETVYLPSRLNGGNVIINPPEAYKECDQRLVENDLHANGENYFLHSVEYHFNGEFVKTYFEQLKKADRLDRDASVEKLIKALAIPEEHGILNGTNPKVRLEVEKHCNDLLGQLNVPLSPNAAGKSGLSKS